MVGAQPGGHEMVCDAREAAGGDAALLLQFGAAREEEDFAVEEGPFARAGVVVEERFAGAAEVVGQAVFGDGDVLHARSGAGSLGKILRSPGPKYVFFAGYDALHIGSHGLILPHGYLAEVLHIAADVFKSVYFSKGRCSSFFYQLSPNFFLVGDGSARLTL